MSNHHEPQEGLRRHKLLPQDVRRKLPRLYAQDGKGDQAIVHLKLFSPYLGQTIYITEGQEDGPEVEFFGWHSADRELQYMYLSNFAEARRGRLPLYERDCYFPKGKTLRECIDGNL